VATRFFAAYNGLLTAVQTALPAVKVYDGPQAAFPTDLDFVLVGVQDPLSTGMKLAVDTGATDWAGLMNYAGRPRDETFTIWSTMVDWTGDDDLPTCRSRAETQIAAIETQIAADLTLGGALTQPGWARLYVNSLEQIADTGRWAIHTSFAVACRARI
jgi:hypothetical protein